MRTKSKILVVDDEEYGIEKSMRIIKESIGSHFDPEVAKAFFSIKDEIINF